VGQLRPRPGAAEKSSKGARELNFMDRTGKIVITLCALLFLLWLVMEQKYAAQVQRQASLNTNVVAAAQTQTATTSSNAVLSAPIAVANVVFDTNTLEQLIVLTNADARSLHAAAD